MKQIQSKLSGEPERTTRPLLRLGLVALVMVVGFAGCKKPAEVAADVNPAATYALVSVDGNTVPCTVQHEGHTLTIKSGSFVIGANGACSSKMVFTPPSGSEATREVKATYTREGAKLTMKWEGAGMTIGTVEGDTFSMNNEGMILAYRK